MLKKVNLILILAVAFVFLVGCNGVEQTTNSGINVRIIEDFDMQDLDIPPSVQTNCWRIYGSIEVLNGLTGEVENSIKFDRLGNWCFPQLFGDYYITFERILDEYDLDIILAAELLIFDRAFNLVEKFIMNEDVVSEINFSNQTIGQNEAGEWLGYMIGSNGEIYSYNFHTYEIIQIAHLGGEKREIYLMPDANKLAFVLTHELEFIFPEGILADIEIGVIDLDSHEITMMYEVENMMLSFFPDPVMASIDEFLLVTLTIGGEEQPGKEVFMIHTSTGEIRTIQIREDDFSWRADESYDRWIFDANTILDERWLLMQSAEVSSDIYNIWSRSDMTSTIRLYDTQTGNVIFEHLLIDEDTLDHGETLSARASVIQLEENIYLIRQSIATGEVTEQLPFPTDVRFEYIVIEITVYDDE